MATATILDRIAQETVGEEMEISEVCERLLEHFGISADSELPPSMNEEIRSACERLEANLASGQPTHAEEAFLALSVEVNA